MMEIINLINYMDIYSWQSASEYHYHGQHTIVSDFMELTRWIQSREKPNC